MKRGEERSTLLCQTWLFCSCWNCLLLLKRLILLLPLLEVFILVDRAFLVFQEFVERTNGKSSGSCPEGAGSIPASTTLDKRKGREGEN